MKCGLYEIDTHNDRVIAEIVQTWFRPVNANQYYICQLQADALNVLTAALAETRCNGPIEVLNEAAREAICDHRHTHECVTQDTQDRDRQREKERQTQFRYCHHRRTEERSETCYRYPVGPFEDQNEAAHGGICVTTQCLGCGALRETNINGNHAEYGGWYLPEDY